jgi:hypothetical protein
MKKRGTTKAKCPGCGGTAWPYRITDYGFSVTRVECDGCGAQSDGAMEEKWAWIYWAEHWKKKGSKAIRPVAAKEQPKPSVLPKDPKPSAPKSPSAPKPPSPPKRSPKPTRKPVRNPRRPKDYDKSLRGAILKAPKKGDKPKKPPKKPDGRKGKRKRQPPTQSGYMTLLEIAKLTDDFEKPLSVRTIKGRVNTGIYKTEKDACGRNVMSREEGLRIVEEWRSIQGCQSLPELSKACGFKATALNGQAGKGIIKTIRVCERMYVTPEECERVIDYYQHIQRAEACYLLGCSTTHINNLVKEGLLPFVALHSDGERRFVPDDVLKAQEIHVQLCKERQDESRRAQEGGAGEGNPSDAGCHLDIREAGTADPDSGGPAPDSAESASPDS